MNLNLALLLVGILSAAMFYRDLVANPLDTGRALVRFYQLRAQRRRSSVLQAVSAEWWRVMLLPVYVLSALVLIGIQGGGQ